MEIAHAIRSINGQPCLITLAGPNGVGKSTFYRETLKNLGWPYVNPDALAKAFWEDHLKEEKHRRWRDKTSAIMTDGLRDLLIADPELRTQCHSFISETVFSSARKGEFLKRAKAEGYRIILIVLGTENPYLLFARVAERAKQGEHGVSESDIFDRYNKVFPNVAAIRDDVDELRLVDNTDLDNPFIEVANIIDKKRTDLATLPRWAQISLGDIKEETEA